MRATELAVIGAGPAGLAAAAAAVRTGLDVTLVDERPTAGGQYLGGKQPPQTPAERQGHALLAQLASSKVDWRPETLVWNLSPDLRLSTYAAGAVDYLEAQAIIVAAGGRELALPFPGWTLPGVMTAGAAQLLVKKHDLLPGKRILLAGSGPLLLPVAHALLGAGGKVVGVLESARPAGLVRAAPATWGNWDRLWEGRRYLSDLRRARVPYRFGWSVVRALGREGVEAAVIAPLDRSGRPMPGREETLAIDTLCIGFGLLPNIELTEAAGCAHRYDSNAGGWVPVLDDRLRTSVPGVYAAGETAGIGGAGAAMVEGRLAALDVAIRLGRLDGSAAAAEMASLAGERRRLRRFSVMINTLFAPPAGLDGLATYDTPVCRCEEVLTGEVLTAIAQGARSLDELKTRTRIGQGPCQGRTCGPLAARLLARYTGQNPAELEGFRVRPPLKPLPLASLAALQSAEAEA